MAAAAPKKVAARLAEGDWVGAYCCVDSACVL